MKKHLLSAWIFLFILLADISASIEVRSTHMTTSDGIANNSVSYIFQDSKGFIWMGTINGLSRYDGNIFMNFLPGNDSIGNKISLSTNHIRRISEDRNKFLWIETSGEFFNCYDLKRDCFVDFTGCNEYRQNYDRRIEASNGDIWLWNSKNGCRKVIYKDNAFTSVVFKKSEGNLPSDSVAYVYQDPQGKIWVGTNRGVAYITGNKSIIADHRNAFAAQAFGNSVFFLSTDGVITQKEGNMPSKLINRLPAAKDGIVISGILCLQDEWVIFTSTGGYIFNMKTGQISRKPEFDIPNGNVLTDNRGDFWIYNRTGKVHYVNARTHAIKTFELSNRSKLNYIDMERYHVVHDSRGIIWISTYGDGLFAYNTHMDELQHFEFRINQFSHIRSNYLQFVAEDSSGGIWVSSEYAGVARFSILNEGIRRIYPEDDFLSDRSNTIRMLTRLKDGRICCGTRNGRVYIYDAVAENMEKKLSFHSNIYALAESPDGETVIGSRGEGLCIDGKWYVNNPNIPSSLSNNNIFTLYYDRKGRLWVGTFGGGLDLAAKGDNGYTFRHFLNKSISQRQIRTILEDDNGWIWVGNSAGVDVFHPDSLFADSRNYHTYNYNNGKLRNNEIKCIYQDTRKRIWIGTSGGGLSMCTPGDNYKNLKFKHYNTDNGLVHNMVQAISEDKQGNLWIATGYGLSRFNPETEVFSNFFFSSYVLGNVYSDNSSCVSKDGKLLFGTNYGLLIVDAQALENTSVPNSAITFTGLQVNGTTMRPGDTDSPLTRAMMYTNEIELHYYQNSFVIDFTTFDYSETNNNTYTYKLENYDKEWSKPSPLSFASYKNLPPGSYKLRVRVSNETGGNGNQEAVLAIVVSPPFWKTTWAFLIYIILLSGALYVTYRLVRDFNALRNKIQIEKQLTEYKLVFFTNISHEFRTPLTLIQGALEKIQNVDYIPKEITGSLKVMNKSTQRMLRLINQLLEFRKMQNNKLALSLEETDVMAFLHEIFLSFKDTADSKNMDFRFQPSAASYKMFIDKGNLDKIVYNLLSNAFKYTPANEKVTLSATVDEDRKCLEITVADTGIGIAKEKRGELFKRFMQSNFSENSTGIGLHLTYELVNVHKGTITYSENPGKGSVFTVTIPTNTDVYEEKDFLIPKNYIPEGTKCIAENMEKTEIVEPDEESPQETELKGEPSNQYKLLIIEDDNDVRAFLKEEFQSYFEVSAEADGISGLEHARTSDVDLIICDVLMPGMTGFEVTRKLKNDFSTSHIPIILLTAMSSAENHLKGVESGADAYITKPFSPKLLLAKTFQLLKQREQLKKKFSDDPNMMMPAICTTEKDKQFADKLQSIMEQQIGNSQFSVDELATTMNLGRSTFYRKVRGVTGYSPNEYMRIIRMKKAAELLLEGYYTVSEVSYKVGIEDPFYFSKCFKKQFGQSPSVYLRGKADMEKNEEEDNKEEEEQALT